MNLFTYTNTKTNHIMKIKAKDIVEADTLYELSTGLKPVKHNYIVCEIQFNIEE